MKYKRLLVAKELSTNLRPFNEKWRFKGLKVDEELLRGVMYKTAESIDPDSHIIALYYLEGKASLTKMAEETAIECSTGTWTVVGYETLELRKRYGAKILRIMGSEGACYVQIAYEASNYDPEVGGITCLLSDIAGNLYDMKILDNVKLIDISFPKYWTKAYPGPKFGVAGTRKLLGLEGAERPLIGAITKPNIGLDTKTYAQLAFETAKSGIDFIKDDEALVNPKYCPLMDRVVGVTDALDKARQETGKKVLYAVNITTAPHRLVELAEKVLGAGANHLMVCMAYTGYGGVQALAEDPSVNVPIHVHRCGHGAYTRNPKHGIDSSLMSKLVRLCGGDQLHVGSVAGKFYYDTLDTMRCLSALRDEWGSIKPTLPVSSAGNHPGNIKANMEVMGNDMLFLAGGGIHGHPDGSTAGGRAMMQAVEAALQGIPVERAVAEYPELGKAVEKWGYVKAW